MKNKPSADITLLLEGTYPYVRGGVSGCVHQLIQGLPQFNFAVVFLGSKSNDYSGQQYSLPENLVHLESHYLWDDIQISKPKACEGNIKYFEDSQNIHEWFRDSQIDYNEKLVNQVLTQLGQKSGCTFDEFLYSQAAWEKICSNHNKLCNDVSFVNYIWTIRGMHAPLFKLAEVAHNLPKTGVFHSISTGYAGFLGTILSHLTGKPLILTEHGIYTKERKIDLQSIFIKGQVDYFSDELDHGMNYYDQLWIRYFEGLGRLIYRASNPIVSLYERNRLRQVKDGADPEKTMVIPNGIKTDQFIELRTQRGGEIPPVIGLLGRIVPIKDIKTFIRAMRTIVSQFPHVEGWLIGPEEEDPGYVNECKRLVQTLGLEKNVRFLGFQKINDVLPKLGIMVLTSISEAFPLVILEAYSSGLPVVTTDVGGCREIIEGNTEDDRALGAAGIVVPIADPEATAQACIKLLSDNALWHAAQSAGIKRVEQYYTEDIVLKNYENIYNAALSG